MRNITELEKAIAEKEGFIALAHTRLGFRCQRPGLELCKDAAESKLIYEVKELTVNVVQLQQMMVEVIMNFGLNIKYVKKIDLF